MSTKEKRIDKLRSNYRNWSIDDVDWLLCRQAGCTTRQAGSHRIYTYEGVGVYEFTDGVNVPVNRPIKTPYAKQAMAYYDEITQERE